VAPLPDEHDVREDDLVLQQVVAKKRKWAFIISTISIRIEPVPRVLLRRVMRKILLDDGFCFYER
jgi:hypothetical protein